MRTQANLLAITLFLTALLIATASPPATCLADGELDLSQQITAEDAAAGDLFGFSQATDGHWLAVGAKFADTYAGEDSGAVYLYRRQPDTGQWLFIQKLVPLNGGAGDEFGESVALGGGRLVVGARSGLNQNGLRSGVAYVFEWKGHHRGWGEAARIEPFDGADDDEFGRSVAAGPHRVIVGARFADNGALADTGAVYLFRRGRIPGGWVLEQKIVDPEGQAEDEFGRAVAYDPARGGRLAVGSREADSNGSVFLFDRRAGRAGWQLRQLLKADDGRPGDYFGQSLAMAGRLLVVGARDADTQSGEDTGAAYVYRLEEDSRFWSLEQKLEPPEGKKKDQFGFALAINTKRANRIAVAARRADTEIGRDTGSVYSYVYDRAAGFWNLDQILLPGDLLQDDEFGQSLAMDPFQGVWLCVGADQSALAGPENAGALYAYTRDDDQP